MTAAGIFGSGAWFTNASVNAAVMTAGNVAHTKLFTFKDNTTATGDVTLTVAKLKPNTGGVPTLLGSMALTNTGDINTTFTMTVDTPTGMVDGKGGTGKNLKDVVSLRLTSDAAGTTTITPEFLISAGKANIALTPGTVLPAGVSTVYVWADWPDTGLPGSNTTGDNQYQQSSCSVLIHWTQTQI
jgi:hypothetical protein